MRFLLIVLLFTSCTVRYVQSYPLQCNHSFSSQLKGGYERTHVTDKWVYIYVYPSYIEKRCTYCGVTYPTFAEKPKVKVIWKKKY